MLKSFTMVVDRFVRRYLPDAFLFAVILTLIVYVLGIGMTDSSPMDMVQYWGNGFWDLLAFAMQMSLIVVTGYILANTPLIKSLLSKLAQLAHTPGQAIILVTFVAGIACLINYGFGLVIGALFARHVIQKVPTVDYRLLVASAYSGYLLWHGGFSGSIPLTIATPEHFAEDLIGIIPITETLFSSANIFIVLVLLATLPLLNRLLLSAANDPSSQLSKEQMAAAAAEPTQDNNNEPDENETKEKTPAERLENSRIVSYLIGILGLVFMIYHFTENGFDLNINIVNFIFLFLGILFHQTPRRFLNSVAEAVKNAGGIIIQFPFYAGIMGMMVASGLSEQMSLWFVSISNEFTFPLFAFLSAGVVNFFVPSGGGQWAVQGPIMIPASLELGVDTAKTAVAVAWGDSWTNMIQPFWTLPLLAIAGLQVRDIIGFCVITLLYSVIPISIGLLFF
ncbi:short-chain fatty acid transporter [Alteribacillus iranensis]|uniref:Short-chain fatty acids transporter n=1 Tax=Alteribacillus iranensis TaxID=930128 RepID=A0A1I2DNV3_9BACI|nr:short-chain fatty acid transporter [Alteribacillus iranensis]SFE82031.1 short-chain fatty acids transporter [Alteribacillus iranensis]